MKYQHPEYDGYNLANGSPTLTGLVDELGEYLSEGDTEAVAWITTILLPDGREAQVKLVATTEPTDFIDE